MSATCHGHRLDPVKHVSYRNALNAPIYCTKMAIFHKQPQLSRVAYTQRGSCKHMHSHAKQVK